MFECGGTSSGPAIAVGGALSSGRSSASTTRGEPLAARARAPPWRRRPARGRTGVTTVMRVLHRVEHDHDGRPDQDRVGNADRIGLGRPAAPPSAAPCRSRDSRTRRPPSAAGRRAARCGFRRSARAAPRAAAAAQGAKASGSVRARAVDLGARRRAARQIRSGSRPMIE